MSRSSSILRNLLNIPGWSTNRKLVVFAIDDYGSIRMSSQESFISLENSGIKVGTNRYNRFETIESNSDLDQLFNVLTKFKDRNGNHPVITPLVCVANPDFEKIKASGFHEYFYEPFTETLKRYPEHDRVYSLWKEGIERKIFMPQFHGREHLNIKRWMADLQMGVKSTHLAFKCGITGISSHETNDIHKNYQAVFDMDSPEDLVNLQEILSDGLILFENLIGYKASYFTPANGLFNHKLDFVLKNKGIELINVGMVDREPLGKQTYKRVFHYFGQRNKFGQRYIVRNALFEPNKPADFDWIDRCLNDINIAFRWKKPAIISSHRVNFSGGLVPENRVKGLQSLEILLSKILNKWPGVEFISTVSLREILSGTD